MYVWSWKNRPISDEQAERLMRTWGMMEAELAGEASLERRCWYITTDGAQGLAVYDVREPGVAAAFQLKWSVALSEFIESETREVLELDAAMPAILAATALAIDV